MNDIFWEVIVAVLILACIYMAVRPGAPVNAAITTISNALAAIVQTATQYDATGNTVNL